ncbi:MAG: hypothetical protein WCS87_11920 [Methylococcaceae bacterium]
MEYVFVRFKEDRAVLADGKKLGQTNQTLLIVKGHHSFRLDGLKNYHPEKVDAVIQETTTLSPYKIEFN